ncbi:ABC transporter permease [Thiohalocapsa marina]|uniref:ABC transporter permease n=1 Tax=Thiohalocapsa marina TaxID=424902 RepID=A0A5M8FR54_9GAMM|nr:ABC transporter permease [Thiohalocapsa marina]KAA6185841.1 ABC transporter permease [Thiohalocapsa marina]
MPVLLTTDVLIFLLFALAVGFGVYAARHEHLRAPWRSVVRSPVGVAALVVICFYVGIGLLDSLHFHPRIEPPSVIAAAADAGGTGEEAAPTARYSTQVLSVLDLWLTGLRERQEKTFSAPFATHLFVKEAIEQPDGSVLRAYPRLAHGGAHLADPAQRNRDVMLRGLLGLVKGLMAWTVLAVLLVGLLAWRRGESFSAVGEALWHGRLSAHTAGDGRSDDPSDMGSEGAPGDGIPWRVALLTLGLMLVLCFIAAELAATYHILGTDKVGEDVFYQSLKSIRTGLVIGTLTTLVMLPAAVILGIMAGYFRGLTDDIIQYLYTTLSSIPGVLLIAAAILMLQVYMTNNAEQFDSLVQRADLRLLFLCLILGVTSWTGLCRLLRGESLKLRSADYVQAATALGVRNSTIIGRHILPNVLHIVMITVVLDFSGLVLAEAVLSYVNIGVDPTMNSWGNMINSARLELARDPIVWWSLAAAFVFMFTLVLAANLFADVVRDAFDPRLRSAR